MYRFSERFYPNITLNILRRESIFNSDDNLRIEKKKKEKLNLMPSMTGVLISTACA